MRFGAKWLTRGVLRVFRGRSDDNLRGVIHDANWIAIASGGHRDHVLSGPAAYPSLSSSPVISPSLFRKAPLSLSLSFYRRNNISFRQLW